MIRRLSCTNFLSYTQICRIFLTSATTNKKYNAMLCVKQSRQNMANYISLPCREAFSAPFKDIWLKKMFCNIQSTFTLWTCNFLDGNPRYYRLYPPYRPVKSKKVTVDAFLLYVPQFCGNTLSLKSKKLHIFSSLFIQRSISIITST